MTQYAFRTAVALVELQPGDDLTFQLPTTSGGTLSFAMAPVLGIPPTGLTKELYHGGTLVASSLNYLPIPAQTTFPEADNTWRLRLKLAPTAHQRVYTYTFTLKYPSVLPILTRKIPLDFFQQGFDNNWNGRQYVSIQFVNNTLTINFDPELATYYNLSKTQYVVARFPTEHAPNLAVKDVRLSVDSSDGGYEGLPGPLPYVLLTVDFTGVGGQPISGSVFGFDVNINDFSITVKFFLSSIGETPAIIDTDPDPFDADSMRHPHFVGYRSQVATDIRSKMHNMNSVVEDELEKFIKAGLASAQTFLDGQAVAFGKIITPWLLGAAFDVADVHYSPINSQPVPPSPSPSGAFVPQGDLVIDYIGQVETVVPNHGGIQQAPLNLTTTTSAVPNVIIGAPFSQSFSAVSGHAPYVWTVTGSLPPGVAFTGSQLSGTPSAQGAYTIQVTVCDAVGAQASRSFSFAANPAGLAVVTASPLPDVTAARDYAAVLTAQGGTAPYLWSATGLPPGLRLSGGGVLSGTLTLNSGSYEVIAKVTDQAGHEALSPLTLTVQPPRLFDSLSYSPRGDGSTAWQPPVVPSSGFGGGGIPLPGTSPGDLAKVDHIVVVMMENRSFDCMLGYLSKEGGRSDVEGLRWENDGHRTQFNYYRGRYYYPQRLLNTQAFTVESDGPDHSHESVKAQIADNMGHFVSDYAKNKVGDESGYLPLVMGYYTGEQLPTYDRLAREFALCDHWFCSHPGPTWPNRFVYMTGDLNRDSHGEPEVNTPNYSDFTPSEAPTLFDHLRNALHWTSFYEACWVCGGMGSSSCG